MEGKKKQLRMSTKSKGITRSVKNCSKTRCHGEVFIEDVLHPSGIMNTALNCYINAVIQCLFNLPNFKTLYENLIRFILENATTHANKKVSTHTHTKKKKTQKRGIKILVSLWYINRQSAQSPVCSSTALRQNLRKEKQVLHKIMHPSNKVTIFPSDVGGASWWEELVCGWGWP